MRAGYCGESTLAHPRHGVCPDNFIVDDITSSYHCSTMSNSTRLSSRVSDRLCSPSCTMIEHWMSVDVLLLVDIAGWASWCTT
jgi:hypothetical protein